MTHSLHRRKAPCLWLGMGILSCIHASSGCGTRSELEGQSGGASPDSCAYPWATPPDAFKPYADGTMAAPQCMTDGPDSLPCGSCDASAVACAAGHHRDCGCDASTALNPLDEWLCACQDGRWACWVLFPAAASCFCGGDGGP